MRTTTTLTLAALLLAPACAVHAGAGQAAPQFDAAETCDQFSQADRRDCLASMAAASAVTLKQAETKAVEMIDQWFENARFKKLATSKLKASTTAFVAYRQAKCAFEDALRGGGIGSAHEITRLACIANTNAQRAMELIYATKDLPPP